MSRLLKFASIGLLSLAMFAPVASAQRGRGFVRGGFGFGFGPDGDGTRHTATGARTDITAKDTAPIIQAR